MDGLLVIDKPTGITSHDAVIRVRRALGESRIGHTGTLDPGASGVLPLVLGRATRLARFLSSADKVYEAVVRFGLETDTYDAGGRIVGFTPGSLAPSLDKIERALDQFRGTFLQHPPVFSAKKIGGEPSYKRVRASARASPGVPVAPVERPRPVHVTAYALEVTGIAENGLSLRVECSAGFYVRALAHDLGAWLGVGGHLSTLRRIRSGDHTIADAVPLAWLEAQGPAARSSDSPIVPLSRMLTGLTALTLSEEGRRRASHGRDLAPDDFISPPPCAFDEPGGIRGSSFRLVDGAGALVGVAERSRAAGLLHPSIVLI